MVVNATEVLSAAAAPTAAMFEYPNNTTEVYFGIPSAIYAGTGLIMFLMAMFVKNRDGSPKFDRAAVFPYWALCFVCAFKGLLLLGVSGVASTSKDVDGEQAMTFPVRYWVDLIAFGFFSFEMSSRTHQASEDNRSLRRGSVVTGLIGTSLFALSAAYPGSRQDWLAIPAIIFYALFAVMSFAMAVHKSMEKNSQSSITSFHFWFEVAGFLWRAAYLSAFICSPAYADVVSVEHTALWFMILDIVFSLWVSAHFYKVKGINMSSVFSADSTEYNALPASNTSAALSQLRK